MIEVVSVTAEIAVTVTYIVRLIFVFHKILHLILKGRYQRQNVNYTIEITAMRHQWELLPELKERRYTYFLCYDSGKHIV